MLDLTEIPCPTAAGLSLVAPTLRLLSPAPDIRKYFGCSLEDTTRITFEKLSLDALVLHTIETSLHTVTLAQAPTTSDIFWLNTETFV